MARYHLTVPRKYDENQWALTADFHEGIVPPGYRLHTPELRTPQLKEGEGVHCIYCLDEMGGVGGGDESLDYCHNCQQIMEGEPQVVLDQDEYKYLVDQYNYDVRHCVRSLEEQNESGYDRS